MNSYTQEALINAGVLDNASVLVIFADVVGQVKYCNRKVEETTGKPSAECIGKNWAEVLFGGPNSAAKLLTLKAVCDNSVRFCRPSVFEGVIFGRDNIERYISWNITPILTAPTEVGGVLLIGNDVTELKEKEASFRKIDDTLKNIFSSISEYGLYVANLDGNITYYAMGSENMFGWQKNEIIFKHINMLHTADDARDKLGVILEQVRLHGRHEEEEIKLVKKSGDVFPVILTVSRFLDAEGKHTGYIFIAKDITERKKLEYQVFQAEKLAALGHLVAGMAHEVNNPLFVISGRLEMLLSGPKLAVKVHDDLKIISEQAERIRKLVNRLLMFARQSHLKLDVLDINHIVESVIPFLGYQKPVDQRVKIEKTLAENLNPVKADLNQLQEVFVNLCINACQAMPGGGTLMISTRNLPEEKFVEVRIKDTGIGISEADLKNIFMPFFSTKREGTGLGLSICYNIIKNHNGVIEVETALGKGTTFVIKLPYA